VVNRDAVSRNERVDPRPRAVDIGGDLLGAAQPGVVLRLVCLSSKQLSGALGDPLDQIVGDVEPYGTSGLAPSSSGATKRTRFRA
jgi:hypothetical protein